MFADALDRDRRSTATRAIRLVLMSASPDLYVPEIGRRLGFAETICTGVRWNGDRFDGALTTPNRQGAEKARCFTALRARYPGVPTVAYANSAQRLRTSEARRRGMARQPFATLRREAERAHIHCVTWR